MASVKTIYSLEELLEGSRINKAQWDKIDSNLWLKRADTSSDETQLNTMIARVICDYTSEQLFDDDLFYAFREEFEDWTQEMFEEVDLAFRREMKRFLRSRGVYTGNNKGKMGSQFASLIKMEDNPQWDPVELNTTTFEAGSRRAQATMKQELPVRSTPNPNVVIPSVEATREGSQSVPPQPDSIPQPVQLSTNPYNWVPPSRPSTYPAITPFPPPVGPPVYDEYKSLPPRPVPNKRLDPTKSTQFVKTYDREKKYTGEPYDLLDDKMRIFFNICYHAEITPEQFHAVFPRILTSRAEEYYLHYVERNDDFATAYAKIKNHFDTNVNHNQYYTDWTSTTFAKTRQQNPDKDLYEVLRTIERFCHHCQMHGQAPRRFKFSFKDDHEFNYEILVDVMYLGGKPVLHIVDSSTAFQGARFLPSLSAKDTWEVLRMLWIDAYQGPPDIITHDAGTNFASVEFRNEAKLLGIVCKQIPVEAHWSIGKLERYHAPQRRAFDILYDELAATTSADAILQMAVKAVNDTAGPDGLVPTLLVFGAYPRLTTESPPSPTTTQRGEAIQKAMKALRKANAVRQVNEARSTRNGPSTTDVLALPLQSEVRVWRDKDGWQGPYKIVAVDGHNVTLDMVNGPVVFRSTLLQPYY